ncbi:MAG: 30S ribosomal protein S26e [Promethearchaeia archaeon]
MQINRTKTSSKTILKRLILIPKKRKSGGKSGSRKGQYSKVQCAKCGRFVARSKAKAVTRRVPLVDGRMYTELKKSGTIIQAPTKTKYYCISCSVHAGTVSQRAKADRRSNK